MLYVSVSVECFGSYIHTLRLRLIVARFHGVNISGVNTFLCIQWQKITANEFF